MANTIKNNGNCYLCGKEFGKTAMKNHLIKEHISSDGTDISFLLKVEDKYDKSYWLYLDVLEKSTLNSLDKFLRKIWLECCGHLSEFTNAGREKVGKNSKIGMVFGLHDKLNYEYDFGSPTDLVITCIGRHYVPNRKNGIELVARNVPTKYICSECGEEAVVFAPGYYNGHEDDKFFYEECFDKLENDESVFFTVTNSPRMGVCGYEGEFDVYEFDADKLKKK
ncbi:MAG: hypothetical protein WBJ13_03455 [Sedimentibacter sp.]